MLDIFLTSFTALLQPHILLLMLAAAVAGVVIGALPGLNATMAVAVLLPLTYSLGADVGLAVLIAVYIGGISGGLVSSILLRIPGTPSSVATTFDGYPLAQQGQAIKALGTAMFASFVGGILSLCVLMMFAPLLAKLAIRFGPAEYFSLSLMALMLVVVLSANNLIKGLLAGLLGLAFCLVGLAPIDGMQRYTFGSIDLMAGIGLVPFMIGLFAIAQILREVFKADEPREINLDIRGVGVTLAEVRRNLVNVARSAGIGVGVGVLPGIGGAASNMLAYAAAKQASKNPESFGKGNVDGVWASETANNASIGGALLPLITLGIPGDGVTAIMIGGFMIHGLQPGPLLFRENPEVVGSIYGAFLIACVLVLAFQLLTVRVFPRILAIPRHFLLPTICVLAVIGSFAADNHFSDIWLMLGFGIIGFLLERYGFPLSPMVLGFVLGPIVEENLRRAMMFSDGNALTFVTQPISATFLAVAIGVALFSLVQEARKTMQEAAAVRAATNSGEFAAIDK